MENLMGCRADKGAKKCKKVTDINANKQLVND